MVNSEIYQHPIQTIGYGFVLGVILLILFIIVFIIILYFIFGERIADQYCQIIDNRSCFCYKDSDAPACCQTGTCDWQSQDKIINSYCSTNPCYLKCPEQYQTTAINLIIQQPPFGEAQATPNFANLCGWYEKIINNFNLTTTISGVKYYLTIDTMGSRLTTTATDTPFSYTGVGMFLGEAAMKPKRLTYNNIETIILINGQIFTGLESTIDYLITFFTESKEPEVSLSDDNNLRLSRSTAPATDGTYPVYFFDKNIYPVGGNPADQTDQGIKVIFDIEM